MITNRLFSPNEESRKVMCFMLYKFDRGRNKPKKINSKQNK